MYANIKSMKSQISITPLHNPSFTLSIHDQQILNNSKFKVTIPSPSPTLYVTVARYWSPETSRNQLSTAITNSPSPQPFIEGRFQFKPITSQLLSPLASLQRPALDSHPLVDRRSRRRWVGNDFHCRCGGWYQKSLRVRAADTYQLSRIVQYCTRTSRTKTLRGTE